MLSFCLRTIHGIIRLLMKLIEIRQGRMPNLAPGKEGPCGGAQAGNRVSSSVGETWRAPGHQVGQHPAMCPGSKGGQQHPGLQQQECSQ